MPIAITCHCGKLFKAKDDARGKAVKCPQCKKLLRVPAQPASVSGAKGVPPRGGAIEVFLIRCGSCGRTLKVRGLVGGDPVRCPCGQLVPMRPINPRPAAPAMTPKPKGPPCPVCEKPIEAGSGVCLECGTNVAIAQQLLAVSPDEEEARKKRRIMIAAGALVVVGLIWVMAGGA